MRIDVKNSFFTFFYFFKNIFNAFYFLNVFLFSSGHISILLNSKIKGYFSDGFNTAAMKFSDEEPKLSNVVTHTKTVIRL